MADINVWEKGRIIRIDSSRRLQEAVDRASQCMKTGGLVSYPTETFYGLGADATNETAVHRLFSAKGRPADRPVLILIPSKESLDRYVKKIPPVAHKLIEAFWPGALTLVFGAGHEISPLLTAGTGKIGIRLSSHPVATALTRAMGVPVTGTSANISGQPACRNAEKVSIIFGKKVDFILDGGQTEGQAASTLLDVTVNPPRILREGMVPKNQLEKIISAQP